MIPEDHGPGACLRPKATALEVAQHNVGAADSRVWEARRVLELAQARLAEAEAELELLHARNRVEALTRGVS